MTSASKNNNLSSAMSDATERTEEKKQINWSRQHNRILIERTRISRPSTPNEWLTFVRRSSQTFENWKRLLLPWRRRRKRERICIIYSLLPNAASANSANKQTNELYFGAARLLWESISSRVANIIIFALSFVFNFHFIYYYFSYALFFNLTTATERNERKKHFLILS